MAMISSVRSISKLKHVSSEALLVLSLSLSHLTTKTTFSDSPLQTVAKGYCLNSRSCHFRPRDCRALELFQKQWRSYYGGMDHNPDIDGLPDEKITFPDFSAKGELVKWEKAKFIAVSGLHELCPEIGYLNIWEGSGWLFAKKGDKVRVKYKCYDMSRQVDHEKSPHDIILGQGKHGQGFHEGIYGMKSGGRRRIAVPQKLCAMSNHKLLKNVFGFGNHPEGYKIFDVILLDIDRGA